MVINFKSHIEGQIWPAFSGPLGSRLLTLLYQFDQSQYLPPDQLLKNQFLQLSEIIGHAVKTVPFYGRKLKAVRFKKNKAIITPDLWAQLPVLSRSKVQRNLKDLLSRNMPKSHGRVSMVQTSGSTGLPIKVAGTDITRFYWGGCALRDHFWHQRDFSGKTGVIRFAGKGIAEFPGSALSEWGGPVSEVIKTGPAAFLNSNTDISLQAKFLLKEEPDYLLSYPSNLQALAMYFMEKNFQLKKLKAVRALGESLGREVRSVCREAWGVPVVDMYTAQEVGYIALQCPENEDIYHVQAENLYVEVVDDEGRSCRPGEVGRVLLTTLHNFAMPLIRYEIGDYAEVGGSCSCGRTLPVLKQILGRKRNMLVLPNGEKTWPSLGMSMWPKDLPIRQFQFVQKSVESIEARLVTARSLSDDEEAGFKSILQEHLRHPFTIDITYLEDIPRSKGGKFEDFVSEVS